MNQWPEIDLSPFEREHVRVYSTPSKPGVLPRVYQANLTSVAQVDSGFLNAQFQDAVQISRRSRVYGFSFSGDLGSWELRISDASGTEYTNVDPITQRYPLASALAPSMPYNADANIGEPPAATNEQQQMIGFPLIWEPNIVLVPNQTLLFGGRLTATLEALAQVPTRFLSITVFVWEFPDMQRGLQ